MEQRDLWDVTLVGFRRSLINLIRWQYEAIEYWRKMGSDLVWHWFDGQRKGVSSRSCHANSVSAIHLALAAPDDAYAFIDAFDRPLDSIVLMRLDVSGKELVYYPHTLLYVPELSDCLKAIVDGMEKATGAVGATIVPYRAKAVS